MTAYILPNAKSQFLSAAGAPLAHGTVYHFVPSTSTLKDTYQDAAASILNTNPVLLDAAGEAVLYGIGAYRQVLFDKLGNQIWDQVTTAPSLDGAVLLTGSTMTGPLVAPSISDTGAQLLTITPTTDTLTTTASLNVQGTTTQDNGREFLAAVGLTSNRGGSASGGAKDKAALFVGASAQTGTGNTWSIRTAFELTSGSGTGYDGISIEIDHNNNESERGATLGAAGLVSPVSYGLAVTGAGTYRSTAAIGITGPGTAIWNRGIVLTQNSVTQAGIQDLGSDTISYEMQGNHTYGIDMQMASFGLAAIRLGNTHQIKARNAADTGDFPVIQTNASNQIIIGGASVSGQPGTFVDGNLEPSIATTYSSGGSSLPWSVVYTAKVISAALQSSSSYASDAAAAGGGVQLGEFYRNGNVIQIRIV